MNQMQSLKMSLQSARSNLLWKGPQYFVNEGSVANESPNELRGFQRPYQNSVARMVVVIGSVYPRFFTSTSMVKAERA